MVFFPQKYQTTALHYRLSRVLQALSARSYSSPT